MSTLARRLFTCIIIHLCVIFNHTMTTTTTTDAERMKSLIDYLGSVTIEPSVHQLAQSGRAKYAALNGRDLYDRVELKSEWIVGGGRRSGWIAKTFARTEEQIMQAFRALDAPPTWTIAQIDEAYKSVLNHDTSSQEAVTFTLVEGLDVGRLQYAPTGQLGSILQVASQFNYLESPSIDIEPVDNYPYDRTQGPLASIEAAAGAIHRRAAVESGKLADALADVITNEHSQYYHNGYLRILEAHVVQRRQWLDEIVARVARLRILPQWVECEVSGARMLQVFAAAPSFQGYMRPADGSVEAAICRALVVPQYEAIAKLAVMRSIATGQTVPLHLTLVGQGAFNNPPSIMSDALHAVANIVRGHANVRVFVHGFTRQSCDFVEQICNAAAAAAAAQPVRVVRINKEAFMQLS